MKKAVCLLSGGIDSSTLTYWLQNKGYEVYALTINYGQKHDKEIEASKKIADVAGIIHEVIDISQVQFLLKSSLIKGGEEIPEGHYKEETMKSTVVPNRNAIMLAIAYGWAVSVKADVVAFAAHGGDHHIYPDCRKPFVDAISLAFKLGNDSEIPVIAPFINMYKEDIVAIGHALGVPYKDTWSCYKGKSKHCGLCGTCVERKEAFKKASIKDPTEYKK